MTDHSSSFFHRLSHAAVICFSIASLTAPNESSLAQWHIVNLSQLATTPHSPHIKSLCLATLNSYLCRRPEKKMFEPLCVQLIEYLWFEVYFLSCVCVTFRSALYYCFIMFTLRCKSRAKLLLVKTLHFLVLLLRNESL